MRMLCMLQLSCHNEAEQSYVAIMGDPTADFQYYGPPEQYEMYVYVGVAHPAICVLPAGMASTCTLSCCGGVDACMDHLQSC